MERITEGGAAATSRPGTVPAAGSDGSPPPALRALLEGAVDYAGLFPPAGLAMEPAVERYAEFRASDEAWALGRFVVPASRLEELARTAFSRPTEDGERTPWPLSVLVGGDVEGDVRRIRDFEAVHRGRAVVEAVELKAETPERIAHAVAAIPEGIEVYVEIPIDQDPRPLIAAIGSAGAFAKVRTGGLAAEQFPSPTALARFLARCVEAEVRFKATAGLHHPLRASYPLTYEPGSARGVMHGYVNVVLATALLRAGWGEEEARAALEETDPAAFRVDAGALAWRDRSVSAGALERARRHGMTGFGSCSFREPVDELPLFTASRHPT